MEYRRFGNTIIARIDRGEEVLEQVKAIAQAEQIKLASVQALGAVGEFTVGVFHTAEKQYHANSFAGDFEIVSLTGTINTMDGAFYTHLHMSAGNEKGEVFGGHLAGGSLPQRGDRPEPVPILKICVKSAHGFAAVRAFLPSSPRIPIDNMGIQAYNSRRRGRDYVSTHSKPLGICVYYAAVPPGAVCHWERRTHI